MATSTTQMQEKAPLEASSARSEPRKTNKLDSPHPWLAPLLGAVAMTSILGIVILVLTLAIPISMLVIGIHYRQPYQCPIEPRISRFLIVGGSVSLGTVASWIILSAIAIFLSRAQSLIAMVIIVLLVVISLASSIFCFVWLIIGCVWTFSVRNQVQYLYPYNHTYCHKTLYQFTFVYLIVLLVLMAVNCCWRCCCGALRSQKQT